MSSHTRNILGESAEKKGEINCQLSCTPVENMREQPKATGLIYSPRRPGKSTENLGRKSAKASSAKSSDTSTASINLFDEAPKRKSLQILQPSADGQKLLTGGKRTTATKSKAKSKKKVKESSQSRTTQAKLSLTKCKEGTESSSSSGPESHDTTSGGQTSSDETVVAMLVQEHAPEKYWEFLAEERRKALEETLDENMKLYQIIEELKAENKSLREKVNDTDYFATMYKIVKSPDEQKNQAT